MASATRTKGRPAEVVAEAARALAHVRGCPVAEMPDDPDLAARVEVYPETRPAGWDRSSGIAIPTPPVRVVVTHCCECGAIAYSDKE